MNHTILDFDDIFDVKAFDTREEQIQALKNNDISRYKTKTIISGPMLECEVIPAYKTPKTAIRGKKQRPTRAAQRRLNNKNAVKHVIRLANTNFFDGGTWNTLTYSEENLPKTEETANKDKSNYIRRLKRKAEHDGVELKYLWIVEYSEATSKEPKRVHHHFITNYQNRDAIEDAWNGGGRTQARRLQPDDFQLEGLARYITKDPRGSKRYSCSRNLKRPTVYESYSKFTRRKAEKLATEQENPKDVFEGMYKQYQFKDMAVRYSDFVPGCYIYTRMRRLEKRRN